MSIKSIFQVIGVESNATGHAEKWVSAIGGFASILATLWVSLQFLDPQGAVLLVASMGASAVLLFAVPHGALSQPWQLVGGHLVSVVLGVACAQTIPNQPIAAAMAVGIAIAAMYYLRCLHPPGGASALSAVIGGTSVHELGYQYVLTPVMLNVAVMLLIALAWNNLFAWRRYPAYFRKPPVVKSPAPNDGCIRFKHADFAFALREIGTYVDITEQDLEKIYKLAVKHARRISLASEPPGIGDYYANGEFGEGWSVRKIIALEGAENGDIAAVGYRVVAGEGEGDSGTATMTEFKAWQRYEVIPSEGGWHRILLQ